MDQNRDNQPNKRISGFRKSAQTLEGGDNSQKVNQAHRPILFFGRWYNVALFLVLYDLIVVNMSYFLALWLRFDCQFSKIELKYLDAWVIFTPLYTVFCLAVFWSLRLYKSIWKYASYTELTYLLEATMLTGAFHTAFITIFLRRMPISYYMMGIMLQFIFMVGIRFSYRFVLLIRNEHAKADAYGRVMVIGAGNAGQAIIRDVRRAR